MKPLFPSSSRRLLRSLLALSVWGVCASAQAEHPCPVGPVGDSAIADLCPMREGMARLKIDGLWGFVDKAGNVAIAPQFDEVEDFHEGLAMAKQNEKYGFIDRQGHWAIPARFDSAWSFSSGLASASLAGKDGYIDRSGQWAIAPTYQSAWPFVGGAAVVREVSGTETLIDIRGKVLRRLDADHTLTQLPARGLVQVEQRFPRSLQHTDGRRVVLPPMAANVARAFDGGVLLATELVEGGALYGFVNTEGRWVVPAKFRSLSDLHEGLAIASPEGAGAEKVGLLNARGEFTVKPAYSRIERDSRSGGYRAYRGPDAGEGLDLLDKSGKTLVSFSCPEVRQDESSGGGERWRLLSGCGQAWLVLDMRLAVRTGIAATELQATDGYALVSGSGADSSDQPAPRRFEIYDAKGRRVLSSDSPQVKGRFNDVFLVAGSSPRAAEGPAQLPVALLIQDYRQVALFTPEHTVVSNPAWVYESQLLEYRYRDRGQASEGPLPLSTEEGWGAVDARGAWVVKPGYRQLSGFRNGVAFAVQGREEWLVDRHGRQHAFPQDGARFKRVAPFVIEGRAENGETVRLDVRNGQQTRVAFPQDVDIEAFHDGLAAARQGNAWGLIDARGQWVVQPTFSARIEAVLNGDDKLLGWKAGHYIRVDGSSVSSYGWLSPAGQILVTPRYEDIRFDAASGNLSVRERHGGEGVMALDGRLLIEPIQSQVEFIGNGWYAVQRKPLHGLLTPEGEWLLKPQPHGLHGFGQSPYVALQQGEEPQFMDVQGRISTRARSLSLAEEDRPDWWVSSVEDAYGDNETTVFHGFDFRERVRLPGRLPFSKTFAEGRIVFEPRNNPDTAKGKGRFALATAEGKVLGHYPFDLIEPMQEGYAVVGQSLATTKAGKSAGSRDEDEAAPRRFGYLAADGKVAIAPKFDVASSFSEGRAVVITQGNLGLIDTSGRLLLQGGWMCGREPVLLDGRRQVVWPEAARSKRKC